MPKTILFRVPAAGTTCLSGVLASLFTLAGCNAASAPPSAGDELQTSLPKAPYCRGLIELSAKVYLDAPDPEPTSGSTAQVSLVEELQRIAPPDLISDDPFGMMLRRARLRVTAGSWGWFPTADAARNQAELARLTDEFDVLPAAGSTEVVRTTRDKAGYLCRHNGPPGYNCGDELLRTKVGTHSHGTHRTVTPGSETPAAETHGAETHGAETHGAETHGAETHAADTNESEAPAEGTAGVEHAVFLDCEPPRAGRPQVRYCYCPNAEPQSAPQPDDRSPEPELNRSGEKPQAQPPQKFNGYKWPAKGVFTSGWGWRWGKFHKGIDIAGPVDTPILAAAAGEVIDAGWNSGGFGNLVKIRHNDGSATLYAHNSSILVRRGQTVAQGQKIAGMGSTGFSTGPHLHFEVHRKGRGAVNPILYLPPR